MISWLPVQWQARYWIWRCSRPLYAGGDVSSSWKIEAIRGLRKTAKLPIKQAVDIINMHLPPK